MEGAMGADAGSSGATMEVEIRLQAAGHGATRVRTKNGSSQGQNLALTGTFVPSSLDSMDISGATKKVEIRLQAAGHGTPRFQSQNCWISN